MLNNKISFIIYKTDEQKFNNLLQKMSSIICPEGWHVEVIPAIGKNLVTAYSKASKKSNAFCKIYVSDHVTYMDNNIIFNILRVKDLCPNVEILGTLGYTLPISGDISQITSYYGKYVFEDDGNNIKMVKADNPLIYHKVHSVDSSFFITFGNVELHESAKELFVMDLCCNSRIAGEDVIVPMQNSNWVELDIPPESLNTNSILDYQSKLHYVYQKHKSLITPLVSVLIPTYNSPKYFEEALQSALNQTYPNLEIIVGDDSTNDETESLIQKYLTNYKNIKYYHHAKPLGDSGGNNIRFLLGMPTGEYVNILFHDDLIYPEKISNMMKYYLNDTENEIGIVTSTRHFIDTNSKMIGKVDAWSPFENKIVDGKDVCRKILLSQLNFIGEYSTVLLKKNDLLTFDGDYDIGVFGNYKEKSMSDISTWLNILKDDKKLVYIKEPLSAFRKHDNQNTFKPHIRLNIALDWLCLSTLAYQHGIIASEDEYKQAIKSWMSVQYDLHEELHSWVKSDIEADLLEIYEIYLAIYSLVKQHKYEDVYNIISEYIKIKQVK